MIFFENAYNGFKIGLIVQNNKMSIPGPVKRGDVILKRYKPV